MSVWNLFLASIWVDWHTHHHIEHSRFLCCVSSQRNNGAALSKGTSFHSNCRRPTIAMWQRKRWQLVNLFTKIFSYAKRGSWLKSLQIRIANFNFADARWQPSAKCFDILKILHSTHTYLANCNQHKDRYHVKLHFQPVRLISISNGDEILLISNALLHLTFIAQVRVFCIEIFSWNWIISITYVSSQFLIVTNLSVDFVLRQNSKERAKKIQL